jgi:hypothetical protein
MYQKGLNSLISNDFYNYVANQSVFLKIKDVASHMFLQKFLLIQISAVRVSAKQSLPIGRHI